MKTEQEQEVMDLINSVASDILKAGADLMSDEYREMLEGGSEEGDLDLPQLMSIIVGHMLGGLDALFAIRDGEEWQGVHDPSEIARRLLKVVGVGEK